MRYWKESESQRKRKKRRGKKRERRKPNYSWIKLEDARTYQMMEAHNIHGYEEARINSKICGLMINTQVVFSLEYRD